MSNYINRLYINTENNNTFAKRYTHKKHVRLWEKSNLDQLVIYKVHEMSDQDIELLYSNYFNCPDIDRMDVIQKLIDGEEVEQEGTKREVLESAEINDGLEQVYCIALKNVFENIIDEMDVLDKYVDILDDKTK